MAHGHSIIWLVVAPARNQCDGASRDELPNEDHGSAPGPVFSTAPHVEAEIHLVEIAVAGHGDAEDPGVEEAEADHAREHGAIKAVKLGAGRHEGLHQLAGHLVVEHGDVPPCSSQEESPLRHARVHLRRGQPGALQAARGAGVRCPRSSHAATAAKTTYATRAVTAAACAETGGGPKKT